MTVYIDEPIHSYGRMVMCHMLADSDKELHEMADRIGVARKWHQKSGTAHSHYDICKSKREIALKFGAIEANRQKVGEIIKAKRAAIKSALEENKDANNTP